MTQMPFFCFIFFFNSSRILFFIITKFHERYESYDERAKNYSFCEEIKNRSVRVEHLFCEDRNILIKFN
jgi:hypothetical protein